MNIKYFTITLLCIVIYTFSFNYLHTEGFSIFKVAYTLVAWTVVFFSGLYFIKQFNVINNKFGSVPTYLFLIIIGWNVALIIRALYNSPADVVTIFGHEQTALALLVPLVVGFSADILNVKLFYSYVFKYLLILLCGIVVIWPILGTVDLAPALDALLSPLYFLIPLGLFQTLGRKWLIFCSTVLLLFSSLYFINVRATLLKVVLLSLVLLGGKYLYLYWDRIINKVYILVLIIPLAGLYFSTTTGQSIFSYSLDNFQREEVGVDTRTFLYVELYQDLKDGNDLLFGRGANGKYYSPHFASINYADSESRLTVEVGWLWLLLRGGYVSIALYLSILLMAIYKAFSDSNNKYIKALGWILIVHYFVAFIQNVVFMDVYNYLLWFTIGIVLNKDIRSLDDSEI